MRVFYPQRIPRLLGVVLVCGLLGLTACTGVAIYHDLDEKDANEILVMLADHGIEATKTSTEKDQKQLWNIGVPLSDEVMARKLLLDNNLPRVREPGLAAVCQEKSLIETEAKLHCQMILGKQGEITNALRSLPGVVDAQVVLNIPQPKDFIDDEVPPPRPSASVVIRAARDLSSEENLSHSHIQQFVAHAVSDLDPRNVSVVVSYIGDRPYPLPGPPDAGGEDAALAEAGDQPELDESDTMTVAGLRMDTRSAQKFKVLTVIFAIIFSLIAGGLIIVLFRLSSLRSKQGDEVSVTQGGTPKPLLEAGKMPTRSTSGEV